jgi:hypothetical protein
MKSSSANWKAAALALAIILASASHLQLLLPRDESEPGSATEISSATNVLEPDDRFSLPVQGMLQAHTVRAYPTPQAHPFRPEQLAEPKFAQFAHWVKRYLDAAPGEKRRLEAEGVELASARRDKLADIIQADPKLALQLAIPFGVRTQLPDSVRDLLETRVGGEGTLAVFAALPEPGQEGAIPSIYRTAEIDGVPYQAFVFGRRLGEPTRANIPLTGVAVGQWLAIDENPLRVLEPDEAAFHLLAAAPDRTCPLDGNQSGEDEVVAEAGGQIVYLCCPEDAQLLNSRLIEAESSEGTRLANSDLLARPWTEGIKKLILIRVDFEDLSGETLTESAGELLIRNVNDFFQEMSYGSAGFAHAGAGSEITPLLRMPRTASEYGALDPSRLRTDARAAARTAGYDLRGFDLDVICFGAVPGFKFAGLAYVGAAGAWLRNSFSTGVTAHELGHNLGLQHANFWDTSGQSVIGAGLSVEYGDKFDNMGSASAGINHFNARYKNYLDWLPSRDVITVAESGKYEIAAFDYSQASGSRALRIVKNDRTNYWVEFRQAHTSNPYLMEGVTLRWAGNGSESTRLLDTTPGSPPGKDDSAIVIGRTFSDRETGIHITPLRRVSAAQQSVEIAVNIGTFQENNLPIVSIAGETNALSTATELSFAATAADPDGDALAYHWDFGNGAFGPNSPEASYRWAEPGQYVVRCVVTDMKGGQASDSLVVQVGTPTTFRLSGKITDAGLPIEGVQVYASSRQVTYTDSSGRYNLVGLAPGTYTLRARLEGYVLRNDGFLNPITVGPSRNNVDFVVVPPDGLNTTTIVAAGSVWQYLDDGSDQGAAWRNPDFDESRWREGPAPLGYGDDIATVVSHGPSQVLKHVTTYFRRAFNIDNPKNFSALTLGLRRDDGGVVYLNGKEIFRSNMPLGEVNYRTLASSTVGGNDERTFFGTELDPALLRPGSNLLAVEIHQVSRTSSDMVFDLELIGTEVLAQAVPELAWDLSGQTLYLSWPDGPTDWILETSSDLTRENPWAILLPAPTSIIDGRRVIKITPSQQQRFYRLSSPR